ncbi:MAG: bifunctional diguanylate cyclase/phosphodiesterase [Gammaproteobacteria bacterium]|nr:bifunctional diguanylate cyclase/phosphodiesterase [Gammaproteobacteria bacterium]
MNDLLTGLYNRSKFFKVLEHLTHQADELGTQIGLLIIDIQRFSKINKRYGYDAGDTILQAVAGILKKTGREGDCLARIGDNQFALVLTRVMNKGHAQLAAIKIQQLLDTPISTNEWQIRCSTVIGISLYPLNAENPEILLQMAEQALEQAKYQELPIGFSENDGKTVLAAEWDIESALAESIAHSELRVYFQPKISLETGKPIGAEALVRWENPSHGLMPPASFLPVAEAIGFFKPLTKWMLNSALRLSSDWTQKWGRLSVSVNIPPAILEHSDFVALVISARELWQQENVDLYLEILEESLISDIEMVFQKLNILRSMGVKIAIDDFGTGYSSLSYFRDIPTDELKIDQAFVRKLNNDETNMHIISLIIEIAHRFGLHVVAEGVEDRDALMFLKEQGCDQAQGYYFAKPMPADSFVDWLETYEPENI